MAGSKPEELVAKLYDEGMTDDEVRAQLVEFGLSSREIHVLVKRAKELMEKEAKVKPAEKRGAGVPETRPAEKPAETAPGEKKSVFGGLFGKKDKGAEAKPAEAAQRAEKPAEVALEAPIEEMPIEAPAAAAMRPATGSLMGMPPAEKPSTPPAEANPQEKKRFGLFGGKKEGKPKEKVEEKKEAKPQEKKPEPKDAKGKQVAALQEMNIQAKMKRLAMIKGAISKPVYESPPERYEQKPVEKLEIPSLVREPDEAGPASEAKTPVESKLARLGGRITLGYAKKQLTPEEEEKMDEELARKLIKGMDNIESEMGELKQLLETLRELNIKLIEILESK